MAKNDRLETLNKIGWGKKKEDNQENTSTKNSRLATLSKIGWGNNGVTNDNGLDDAQKAARARTVALRNYENELWKYKNGKAVNKNGLDKTQQAARDRTVWARQPEVQKQLQNRANYLKERNKYQNGDSVEQRGAIDYIQTKGQDAFYNAMLGINQSATAIIPALKAFVQTELDNSKATLRGEDLSDKKNSLQAYKEAFDKSIAEQQGNFSGNFSNEADISPSFENARSNPVVKFIGDQNATMSAQLPNTILGLATSGAGIAPLMANAIGATAIAAKSYPAAFKQATDERADLNTAGNYASISAAIEGIGEYTIGGAAGKGTGLIDAGVKKFAGKAITNFLGSKPLLHALGKMAAAGAGEGFEEMAQDVLDVYAQRSTYNKNATFDIKDIAYDGLLGAAMGIGFNIPSLPANYVVYKSDYDTVNSLSKAGAAVHNKEDVDTLKTTAKTIADSCTDAIAQLKSQGVSEGVENDISRLEYVRIGAQSVLDSLDKNADTIVSQNAARRKALDNIANNPKEDIVKNLANLVDEVSKGNNTGKNDYKATVDYILSQQAEAKAKYQQAASIEDTETASKYAADSAAYAEAVRQLRNNQKEVQKARASEETYGDVTAEETKTTVAEANTTADEAKTATAETSENAAKSSETTVKQETPKEKGDSLRDSILKEHGILGVNKDIDTAADDIVAKYGSYKNAVDKIIEAQKNVREDTTISDEEKQTQISRLQDIIRSIRNRNTARQREAIENFSKIVKKYGLEGVEFIDVESDDVRSSPKVNGYYDPATKKIYVSPYSQDIQTSGSIVVHELTHHGATADHALVNDILKAKDTLVSKGQYSEELFDYSKYETTYKAETEKYINSEDGKAEIAALIKNGMTEEQAIAEAAKGYVNEEIAAHFMQEIMSNDDALKRLAKEDRPLLKRILDAIVNFFSGKKHRNERMATLAADKIRAVLRETEDVEVDNSRKSGKSTARMQSIADENAKIGNTGDGRRFSLTRPMEEAGNLIAVHNVNKEKALKILDADGMPMPSIAIAKADIGHSDFGNISFVFGAETVDPKANRYNKVYSADVWSPTFPSIEYETNQATESRIVKLYNSIKSKYGSDIAKALYPYYTNLSYELDSKGGAKGIISSLSDDTRMMNVFLADTGETPVKNVVKETSTEMSANTREMAQYLIDTRGADFLNDANRRDGETSISARNRFLESHEQELRDTLQKYYERNGIDAETAKIVVESTRKGELMSQLVKPAQSILTGNTTTTNTTVDYEATNEKILDTVDKKKYKEWLNNLFGDAVKNEGIRNGKDPFTPSGNRRSFSATHYPVTLDNIVKAMRGSENVKGATTMTENAKAIRSASAEEYKSIDAIHKNEGRLQKMSESEITAQWDAFDNRLYAIIDSLMDSVPTIDDRLIESRRIGQVIIEASRNPTESNIRSTLEKYSGKGAWYKFTDQTVSDIQSLVNDIREAPTNIFEAKPERVVGLDEVKYAVVPDDLSKETVRAIADKGIEVRTYESGNEESRLETLNNLDGVRFSKDVDTDSENIRYSKEVDADGKPYVRVDDSSIDAENPSDIVKVLRDIAESKGFYNMAINGQNIGISNKRGINEWVFSRDATNLLKNDKQTFDDKMQSFQNANELLETAKSFINEEAVHKKKFDNFARGVVRFMVGDNGYTADILVGIRNNQNAELYDIVNIAPTKIAETPNDSVVGETTQISNGISADTSLPQSGESVNRTGESVTEMKQSNVEFRNSKDVFTPEEREKIISKGYTDYLARQFVVKDKSGEHAKAISISSRKKLAQQLAKPLKGVNASDALVAITPVFETIEKADGTPEQRAEKAYKAAEKAANDIISMMKDVNTNTLYDQYAELRNYLRTTKLDTSSVKADIADYNDWRKSHMGSLKLGNDGMQIDTAYQELSGMYPEFFPANIENPADQLIRIGEISDNLKKVMDNPILSKEGSDSVVRSFANAILAGYEEYAQETLGSQNSRMRDYVKTAAETVEQKNAQIKDAQEQLADTKADFRRFAETVQTAYETDVKHLNEQIQARDKSIARLEKYVSKTEKGAMEVSRKKAISAFAKLQKTYEKPTTTNGVPENWKGIVSSMLNAFGNEDHAINAQTAIDQLAKMETLVSDSKRYDSKSVRVSPEQMENLSWQISGLRTFFENFSESQKKFGTDANNSVDIATSQNAAYIDSVRNLAETVNHLIRAENELFVGEKKAEASAIAYDFIDEIRERGKKFEKTGSESGPLKQWASSAVLDYTAPDVFLHNLGETGDQFAKAYREAQNKSTLLNQHYGEAMHSLVGDNYSADRTGIKGELIDVSINGENLKVSRQQLMSLYLLWKRPQARQHIEEGGVYFLNANGEQQGKPIVIHESEYRSLIGKLSNEDIRIADGIGKYLSETCAEWGNEASMKLYGYKKFNDPNYFPITVHGVKDQYHDEIYSVTNSLEHKSFTKHVDKNSVKALDIHDIFTVSDNHAKEMAQYSGFAPINSTFTRVYNAPGVQTALLEQYGRRAIGYMNDFLDRANGKPVGKDTKATDVSQKFASMAKKAAVGFNVSTAMKQPISYLRAAPELDMDVFAKAGAEIFSPSRYKALYNEMVTNSGIARIKALGFSDVGIGKEARGNYSDLSFSSAYNKGKFVKSKFEDASMWLAGKADEITWVRIWDACKMQIDKENAKLPSEKRIQLTTEKFNQIVGRTQVVDSVLDSAPASYNSLFKILHPFMNEPMKTVSSLWYAYEEMKKGVPGGKQKFVKQIASTAASNLILEPLIASVIGALRDKEDEDPEKFAEKVLNKMSGISLDSEEPTSFKSVATSEIVSGIAFAPMATFFYSIFTDVLNGFEGDSMNSANLYEFMKASVKLTEALMKGDDYSGQKSIYNLAAECATSMAQAFGIPANTMRKDLNSALRTALYYTQDIVPMNNIVRWEMNKLYYNLGNKSARTEKYFYDILIDAYNQEDKTAYNIMREDLDEMGIQSKEIVEIIEKRSGAIKPGSSVWNTELQARFDLPTKSTSSQVEQMVTRVYAACQKIDTLDESKALPKRPDKYSYTDRHGDKVEMSTQEYDKFVEDVGVLRYKLCAEFASSNAWSKLSAEQQLYAITKAYDFAARYYRQQFSAEYDSGDTWMKELYGKQLRIKDVATTIISKAFKK